MKYLIKDLAPGKTYYLQFRSKAQDGEVSEWSRTFSLTTSADVYAPNTPTGLTVTSVGNAFQAAWTGPTTSTDGSPATDLKHYLVKVESSLAPGVTKTYVSVDTKFELTFEKNLETFTTARGTVGISVAAQDMTGNVSAYTSVVTASNPAPANVTGLSGAASVDAITLKWTANTEPDLIGYQVHRSKTGAAGTYTQIWAGTGTQYTDNTIDWFTDHWYRVYAVDVFGTLSASPAQTGAALRPNNSFSIDSTAPATPAGLAITLTNATDGKTAKAEVTWTAVTDTDGDLSEYIIDYKPSSETAWNTAKVDYEKTALTITGLLPYVNYDFRIRSSDWSANLSAWSATVTKTATANTAPATVTGVSVTPGRDSVTVAWTANTEPDVANGNGLYMVDIATNSGFTTGLSSYKTGAESITVTGLAQNQIYYARVKAVDSLGLASASWSTSANGTTGTFPTTSLSDGNVPTGAPTLTATPGIGYIFLSWTVLANADPVTYEVFMSTTNGFTTYDATTKIGEISGTSMFIENTVAGTALAYGTTYYFKVRARDRDGVSATVSAQASATPSKATSGDITSVNADIISAGAGFINTLTIASGGSIQSTGYTGGGTTGFSLSNTGLIIKGTNNIVAVEAVAAGTISAKTINIGTGGVLNVDATGVIKSNNYSGTTTGYQLSNTGLVINDGDIDAKNLRTNTAVIGDLTIGRSADSLGSLKSFGYVANTTGFKLDKTGLEINSGLIKAGTLLLQTGSNMVPPKYAGFEYASSAYNLGTLNTTYSLATGSAKFQSQSLQINITATASQKYTVLGTSLTDYNTTCDATPVIISAWIRNTGATNVQFKLNCRGNTTNYYAGASETINAGVTWTRYWFTAALLPNTSALVPYIEFFNTDGGTIQVDGVQVEKLVAGLTTPSLWTPPGITSAEGGILRTGAITSNTTINVAGTDLPAWSVNMDGNMQVGDALVRGKLIVGTTTEAPVNRAPGGGDFESNATGYQVYSADATGTAIARTTTSPIEGTGSLSVTAAAGAKTRLGASWTSPITYQPGTRITISAKVKVNTTDAGSTIRIALFDNTVTTMAFDDTITNPVAGTVYDLLYEYIVDEGQTVSIIAITHAGTALTTTQTMIDSISVTDDTQVGNSYVSSPDYSRSQSGWRISGDGSVEFNNGIFRGALGANMVTGETLSGNIVLASTFTAGDENSRHVNFSDRGIQLWEDDGTLMVDLPTDSTKSASIQGDLLATSLTVSDQLAIRGSNNELARGASVTLQSGTTAPNSPPTVSVGHEMISRTPDTTWDPYKYGFAWDNVWNSGGGCFLTVQNIYGANASIDRLDKTTGLGIPWSAIALSRIRVAYGGITVLGGVAYVLGQDINGAWYIEGRDLATKAKVLDVPYSNSTSKYTPTIGNDGTNLLVAYMKTADRKASIQSINPSTGAGIAIVNTDYAFGAGKNELSFVGKGTYDFGTTRYVIARRGWYNVYVYDSTGAKLQTAANSEDWLAGGNITGMAWAATDANPAVFWVWDAVGGKIIRQSNYRWAGTAAADSTYWVGSTWYDNSTAPAQLFNVTNKALTSNVATLTTSAPHGMSTGNVVIVTGVDATFNGTYTLTGTTPSTISYSKTAANVASTASAGQVGVQSTTHETTLGPITNFTMLKRQAVTVTVPPLPVNTSPTGDDVNSARIYMAKGTSKPSGTTYYTKYDRQATLATNNRVGYFNHSQGVAVSVPAAGVDASGAEQPPSTNGFAGVVGAAAVIKSSNNQFSVDGLGIGNWGGISVASNGNVTIHGSDMTDTGWLDTGTGFTATANCTLNTHWVRRIGKLCMGYFNVTLTNALNDGNFGNITLINVPVGWRTSFQNGQVSGGTAGVGVDGAVTVANGIIIASGNGPVAAGGSLSLSVTWFCD